MSYKLSDAFLADWVYRVNSDSRGTFGSSDKYADSSKWKVIETYTKYSTGYQGALFYNTETGQYVFSSRGTELGEMEEEITDLHTGIGELADRLALFKHLQLDVNL